MTNQKPQAAVLGKPIAHSRSPLIHNHWLRQYGLSGGYDKYEVEEGELGRFITTKRQENFVGFNVTIPHKPEAFDLCEWLTPDARAAQAVNTLWWDEADRLCGDNTDVFGFLANLDAAAPGWDNPGIACLLGAGGAARGIVHALLSRGIEKVVIANRTRNKGEALARVWPEKIVVTDWSEIETQLDRINLLINATALGMVGKPSLAIDLTTLPAQSVVVDTVYAPLKTKLLLQAEKLGLRPVDGLGMLLHQARPGFHRWFGQMPEVDHDLRQLVEKDLGATKPKPAP